MNGNNFEREFFDRVNEIHFKNRILIVLSKCINRCRELDQQTEHRTDAGPAISTLKLKKEVVSFVEVLVKNICTKCERNPGLFARFFKQRFPCH